MTGMICGLKLDDSLDDLAQKFNVTLEVSPLDRQGLGGLHVCVSCAARVRRALMHAVSAHSLACPASAQTIRIAR
jgi:hypothetical protein